MNDNFQDRENIKLVKNRAKCCHCGDIIESKHRHDFVTCSCYDESSENSTGIYVDGGLDYERRGFNRNSEWIELSEYSDKTISNVKHYGKKYFKKVSSDGNLNLNKKSKKIKLIPPREERYKLYEEVSRKWGQRVQLDQAQEECAELIQAISKYKRDLERKGPKVICNLIEETVDVFICLEQVTRILDNLIGEQEQAELFNSYFVKKLDRLRKKLEK